MASTGGTSGGNTITVEAVIEHGANTVRDVEKTSENGDPQPPGAAAGTAVGDGRAADAVASFSEEQLHVYAGDESGNCPLYEDRKPVGNYECK